MVTVIIPARGGSIGIPRKNLVDLGRKPLVAWSIEFAKVLKPDRIVVNTDNEEIGEICELYGADVLMRQSSVHQGHAINPVLDTIEQLKLPDHEKVFMFLPTSPFRELDAFKRAIELLDNNNYDTIVGVSKSRPFHSLRWIKNKYAVPLASGNMNLQKQDVEQLYVVNGTLFLARVAALLEKKSFHTERTHPLLMGGCIDIDTFEDLDRARERIK